MSEAAVIADAVHQMEASIAKLEKELKEVKAAADQWQHTASVWHAENESLRKQMNRLTAKADHYMKAHAGLVTGLRAMGDGFLNLVRQAEAHAYGDQPPQNGHPQPRPRPVDEAMPAVVRAGPRAIQG